MLYAVAAYLVVQVLISVAVSRYIHSESDYLVAGRSLGLFMASFSLFATWFGAETVMASSGAIAAGGLAGSRADPFGYTICLLLMGLLVAGAMRARNYVTVGDFFRENFGRRNEVLGTAIMIPTSLIWAAAQLQAFALIISTVSSVPLGTALLLATVIVIAYTCLGGLLGDVIHDLLQGVIIITGLLILLAMVVAKAGGPQAALASIQPSQLRILGPGETWLKQFDVWMIPILGSLVAPEALSRTLATRDETVARRACYAGGLMYFFVGMLPVLVALIGTHLISGVDQPDAFLPTLVRLTMPPWVAVIFLGALVSAILSTIDSTLLSIGGLVSHNLILPAVGRPLGEKAKVLIARLTVVAAGFIAYAIAIPGASIYVLVETASSFGSAGFLVCVLGGLYLRVISPAGATVVLLGGVLSTLLFDYALGLEGAFIFTLLTCASLYLAFALRGRAVSPVLAELPEPEPVLSGSAGSSP